MSILGLDIGGANIKAAHSGGSALTKPFELWKNPANLAAALRNAFLEFPPFDTLAVTMTGELCDCFRTRREGVQHILDAVEAAAGNRPIRVWQTSGRFVDQLQARSFPLASAAANWHALATWVGRLLAGSHSLLIDVGSTTSDVIPLRGDVPAPAGLTDQERLKSRELVYTGVRRTPLCALLGADGAAEWFATTLDVYLVLGKIAEDAADRTTADGRPATVQAAHARLARMCCADSESCPPSVTSLLARELERRQVSLLRSAIDTVAGSLPGSPAKMVLSGSGEFLARAALDAGPSITAKVISVSNLLGTEVSEAACAYALTILAQE